MFSTFLLVALAAGEKPNIVFMVADDLGRADCGFMGGTVIKTPHLDRLAAKGAILDAHYVQPVCTPTRAALMTGRYPMRHGLQTGVVRPWADYGLPLGERTIGQVLRDQAGYRTAIVGKWHLGHFKPEYLPTRRGFDHQYGHYNGAIDYFQHDRDGGFDWHKDDRECRDKGYSTNLLAEDAAKFVAENAGKKPFFLYVPFNAVHAPLQVPEKYLEPYSRLKGNRRLYAGMLAAMDEAVGKIEDAVEKAGQGPNTLFVFTSDNGGPSPGVVTDNGKYRGAKGSVYEGGVRVVAFATWPGNIPSNTTLREPIHAVDWFPTLSRLAGLNPAANPSGNHPLDGKDIWPVLTRGAPSPHDAILINTNPAGGALRKGDWKLVVHTGKPGDKEDENQTGGGQKRGLELYNLAADPWEKENLASGNREKLMDLVKSYSGFSAQAAPPLLRPKPAGFKAPKIWGDFQ